MDFKTGRPNHVEDYLASLHTNQWYTWADSKNKVYANLRLTEKIGVKGEVVNNPVTELPTEQECIDGLAQMQADFDSLSYVKAREKEYPSLGDIADAIFKKEAGDSTEFDALATKRTTIKNKYTKG